MRCTRQSNTLLCADWMATGGDSTCLQKHSAPQWRWTSCMDAIPLWFRGWNTMRKEACCSHRLVARTWLHPCVNQASLEGQGHRPSGANAQLHRWMATAMPSGVHLQLQTISRTWRLIWMLPSVMNSRGAPRVLLSWRTQTTKAPSKFFRQRRKPSSPATPAHSTCIYLSQPRWCCIRCERCIAHRLERLCKACRKCWHSRRFIHPCFGSSSPPQSCASDGGGSENDDFCRLATAAEIRLLKTWPMMMRATLRPRFAHMSTSSLSRALLPYRTARKRMRWRREQKIQV